MSHDRDHRRAAGVRSKDGHAVDKHAIERKMASEAGLFKQRRQQVTVDSLLRDFRKKKGRLNLGAPIKGVRHKVPVHGLGHGGGHGQDPSQKSFMASAMKRLALLEHENGDLKGEVRALTAKNGTLSAKIQALEAVASAEDAAEELFHLRDLLDQYKKQVEDMEGLLADYGLVWCGFRAGEDVGDEGSAGGGSTVGGDPLHIYFDMKKMQTAIDDLNCLAKEGKKDISRKGGVAKFTQRTEMSIVFYRDGLFFENGPLRPYNVKETQNFVQDILEGYFPLELKESHPEGVVFRLHDKSGEDFVRENHLRYFGKGARGGHETAEHFLRRLPKSVIRNGQVIEIRKGVSKLLKGPAAAAPSGVQLIETPLLKEMETKQASGEPQAPVEVATLQLRLPTGKRLILKLKHTDTVGTLRQYVSKSLGEGKKFELRTNYPRRAYNDDSETLKAAGLVPNAALNLRMLP